MLPQTPELDLGEGGKGIARENRQGREDGTPNKQIAVIARTLRRCNAIRRGVLVPKKRS